MPKSANNRKRKNNKFIEFLISTCTKKRKDSSAKQNTEHGREREESELSNLSH